MNTDLTLPRSDSTSPSTTSSITPTGTRTTSRENYTTAQRCRTDHRGSDPSLLGYTSRSPLRPSRRTDLVWTMPWPTTSLR